MLMLKTECTVTGLDTARIADDPRLRERFRATCENVSHYPDGVEIVCPDTEDERDCTLLTAKREFPHLRLLGAMTAPAPGPAASRWGCTGASARACSGCSPSAFWLRTVPGGPDKTALVRFTNPSACSSHCRALARVAWRMREGFPAPAGPHAPWERRGAIALHVFLIVATLLMPLSGVLRSLAYARPVSVFGWPLIPKLLDAKHETLYAVASNLHDGLALLLSAALALHVAAALKHHWIDRDATLTRILGLPGEPADEVRRSRRSVRSRYPRGRCPGRSRVRLRQR